MQDNENLSQQSPSPSNSDLNSLASDDDDDLNEKHNRELLVNGNPTSTPSAKASGKKEHVFIEDMHQKLEKQIQRMRIAPPAPPRRNPANHLNPPRPNS